MPTRLLPCLVHQVLLMAHLQLKKRSLAKHVGLLTREENVAPIGGVHALQTHVVCETAGPEFPAC